MMVMRMKPKSSYTKNIPTTRITGWQNKIHKILTNVFVADNRLLAENKQKL